MLLRRLNSVSRKCHESLMIFIRIIPGKRLLSELWKLSLRASSEAQRRALVNFVRTAFDASNLFATLS